MKNTGMKKYLLTVVVQILLLAIYAVSNIIAFKFEQVVLAPVKFILPIAIAIVVIDLVVVFIIFKSKSNKEGVNVNE